MNTIPFVSTATARDLQRNYKSLFIKANKSNEPIMIISNNKPQAIILSPAAFKRYADSLDRQQLWETITSIQADNKSTNPKDVDGDVLLATKRAKMRIYAQSSHSSR